MAKAKRKEAAEKAPQSLVRATPGVSQDEDDPIFLDTWRAAAADLSRQDCLMFLASFAVASLGLAVVFDDLAAATNQLASFFGSSTPGH